MARNTRYSVSNSSFTDTNEDTRYSGYLLTSSPFYEEEALEPDNWTEKDVVETGLAARKAIYGKSANQIVMIPGDYYD